MNTDIKNINQIKQFCITQLDLIESSSKKICKDWGITVVPLGTIKQLTVENKLKTPSFKGLSRQEIKDLKRFVKDFNYLTGKIYTISKMAAKEMGSTGVPIATLEEMIANSKKGLV